MGKIDTNFIANMRKNVSQSRLIEGPTQRQLFGGVSIYTTYEQNQRFLRVLNDTFFRDTKFFGENGIPKDCRVFFVPREGGNDAEKSYYRAGFIERFCFSDVYNTAQQATLHTWLTNAASDCGSPLNLSQDELNALLHHLLPSNAAPQDLLGSAETLLSMDAGFDLLVRAYTHIYYRGATPSALESMLVDEIRINPNILPFFCINDSKSNGIDNWITGTIYGSSGKSVPMEEKAISCGFPVTKKRIHLPPFQFKNPYSKLDEFFSFCESFFKGQKKDNAAPFKGMAIPVYDRWERRGPFGGFFGWIFIEMQDGKCRKDFYSKLTHQKKGFLYRAALRPALNEYFDYTYYALADEIESEFLNSNNLSPLSFFINVFPILDGYSLAPANSNALGCDQYYEWQVNEKSKPILLVRLDESETVQLTPMPGTIIPDGLAWRSDYGYRVAAWARSFFTGIKNLAQERQEGRLDQRETISHETKQIVSALRYLWLIEPDEEMKSSLSRFFEEKGLERVQSPKICPFPRLFSSAGSLLMLQLGTNDIKRVLDNPTSLKHSIMQIWEMVADSMLSLAVLTRNPNIPEDCKCINSLHQTISSRWSFDSHFKILVADSSIPLPCTSVDKNSQQKWLLAVKVLQSIMVDIFKHSDPDDFTVSLWEKQKTLKISVDAAKKPEKCEDKELNVFNQGLVSRNFFESEEKGGKIIREISDTNPDFININASPPCVSRYHQTIVFNWNISAS